MNRRTLLGAASLLPLALLLQARGQGKPMPPPEPKAKGDLPIAFICRFKWASLDKWPRECPPARLHAQLDVDSYRDRLDSLCYCYSPAASRGEGEPEYVLVGMKVREPEVVAGILNAFGLEYAGSNKEAGAHIFIRSEQTDSLLAEGKNAFVYAEKWPGAETLSPIGFVTDHPLRLADEKAMEFDHQRRKERHGNVVTS